MLWSRIQYLELEVIEGLVYLNSLLTPIVKAMIHRLQIRIPWNERPTLRDRQRLCKALQELPGLRRLDIEGLDNSADEEEKGTIWKPQDLRIILDVKNACPQFTHSYSASWVRLELPRDRTKIYLSCTAWSGFTKFEASIEYEKWLQANRKRRLRNELA